MKRVLALLIICSGVVSADENLTKKIDSIIDIISHATPTVSKTEISKLDDPFMKMESAKSSSGEKVEVYKPSTKKKKVYFTLHTIINKKARINGQWVTEGDILQGYQVMFIGTNYVKLKNKTNKERSLVLNKPDNSHIQKGGNNDK